ncbi:amino acid ABC transporter substrate-binding protein [Methanobrevibacter millerae]|jgi:polar amino acid transport system substrate-binding protein|uniref:Polar amino acid transport system substrate-binding protein n=1 Tax=Methanobrevibacter millerae TaxID=230361 RepID=A0A1G5XGF3_9EURY|nr:amino acid ABC transporter substrate-binding protein [Methanobrevibacter millerae]SDA69064.1 polar amino acid transport system substrate-binding protein [Methanobrevibacter millerae]
MNKKIGFILALIVIAFVVMGTASAGLFDFLGGGNNATKVTNDNNTFIVGFDAEFPPYGFKNGSEYVGFDLDLAKEVCKRNNWTYVAQPIDWDAKDAELDSGSIDCIWNGFTINGRENNYTWSEPYIDNKQVFVVKADSNISSIADLSGKVVETQKDSSALASLEGDNKTIKDTFTNLVQVADYNTAFMDLQSGACQAVAMDIGVAQYQINSSNSSSSFIILDQPLSSEQYGVGFKLNNTQLRNQVQATLDEMYADGTIQAIAANYSSYGVPGSLILK